MSTPRVSVILNCLNGERYLREALDSVYAQTVDDWEVVFWDNGSSDASGAIARSYDSRVRYFRGETTVPLGAARNAAMQEARGRFLAFLDADDLWLPNKLEMQLPLFDANAGVGLVYSNSWFFNQETGAERLLYRGGRAHRGDVFEQLLGSYFLSLETVVLSREALAGLDEWFDPRFNLVEEADLFIRLAYAWKVDYVPQPLAKWRIHPESLTSRDDGFGDELSMLLEKLERLFPDLEQRYPQAVGRFRARVAYREAMAVWRRGQAAAARQALAPHLAASPRLLAPYVLTYFPYPLYRGLMRALLRQA